MNTTKPFTQNDLAKALGVSKGLVSQHAKRGMPTHSLEAAREWRDRNLAPLSRKEYRIGGNNGGKAPKATKSPKAVEATPPPIDDREVTLRSYVPVNFFRPTVIAAAAADAGVALDGEQAIVLTGCLFMAYMTVFGEEHTYNFDSNQLPGAGTARRAQLAAEIDAWIRTP